MTAVSTFGKTGKAYIDALLGEAKWATGDLTYSFPATATSYANASGSSEMTKSFGAFSTTQQWVVRSALQLFSATCNLNFREAGGAAAQQADLRFAKSDAPGTAWAYFPATDETGGDVWINKSSGYYESPEKGNYAYLTFMHEIGHALGLEHAHESGMPSDRDSMEYTVMTYRSYAGASAEAGYMNETWGYAQSLMMYDIAALQHMYGANFSTNSGGTRYSWSPSTGEMFINGAGQGAPGGNQIFTTIWDGGGVDTYDLSNYTNGVRINLEPGAWTQTAPGQLAKLHWNGSKAAAGNIANALLYNSDKRSLIEKALGGSGNDIIKGNVANNTLWGKGGNDKLYGMGGKDTLYGGSGTDTFMFCSVKDSQGSAKDTIKDFVRGVDHIHLRGIDADTGRGGNQAFSFIGRSSFSGDAGELRFSNGVLMGDVNGDAVADFKIKMSGLSTMSKGDLYL